jgi:ubiquinone/menaquinone biosynthesis C-methylase UbiE
LKLELLFAHPEEYNFKRAPDVVERVEMNTGKIPAEALINWEAAQGELRRWLSDPATFTRRGVAAGKQLMDNVFEKLGRPSGNVLDIGGGWGLFRQWWDRCDQDVYVVHDPGRERLEHEPTSHHREAYEEGLARPLTFVVDFGENLDYRPAVFNCIVMAEALDHMSDIEVVLAKAVDALQAGGKLLIINHVSDANEGTARIGRYWRAARAVGNPLAILRKAYRKIAGGERHLRSFSRDELRRLPLGLGMLEQASTYLAETGQLAVVFEKQA